MTRIFAKALLLFSAAVLSMALFRATTLRMAGEETRKIVVQVGGLACPFCAYGLEKRLGRLRGVASAETDIAQGLVVLRLEKNASPPAESEIREAVKRAGFTVLEIHAVNAGEVRDGPD